MEAMYFLYMRQLPKKSAQNLWICHSNSKQSIGVYSWILRATLVSLGSTMGGKTRTAQTVIVLPKPMTAALAPSCTKSDEDLSFYYSPFFGCKYSRIH